MTKQTTKPARTSDDPAQPNGFAAKSTGTLVVKKVSICEIDINGYHPFVLDTCQVPSKVVHVHPNKDPEIYRDMIALVPAIADLKFNEQDNRVITLRDYWQVSYKWEKRSFSKGMKEVMVARSIKVMPSKRADIPAWMSSEEELRVLAFACHCGPDYMDEVLGLPRANWVSRQWCLDTMDAKQKETNQQLMAVRGAAQPAQKPPASDERADFAAQFPTTAQRKEQENNVSFNSLEDMQESQSAAAQAEAEASQFEHELDPDKALFAIPNHLAKTYGKEKAGKVVRDIYKMPLNDWFKAHDFDARMAWGLALDYETKNPVAATEAEKIAQKATQSDETQSTAPAAPATVETPAQPPVVSSEVPKEIEIVEPPKAIAIVERQTSEIIPFDPNRALEAVKGKIALLNQIIKEILVDGVDYGNVPGSEKKCLYKPGAEKLLVGFDIYDKCVPTANTAVDWKNGFFNFEYECTIYSRVTGRIEGTGIGSCNSMESKYRWREGKRVCPHCGKDAIIKGREEYGGGWICFAKKGGCGDKFGDKDAAIVSQTVGRILNEDICDIVNTISKMAQKRALVAATLNATAASSVFTQDLEDLKDFGVFEGAA